jgi:hypothetical protein
MVLAREHPDGAGMNLMTPLAQGLARDSQGSLRQSYCDVFEGVQNEAAACLRQPMSPDDYALCQSVLEMAETAEQVVNRFWDRCHGGEI